MTHSDALIREAVGKPGFNVFHMLPCGADLSGSSQLRPLNATEDLEVVLADLIGDLAAYRPGGKGLIFEGGGDSDFDKIFVSALFSEELRGINLISGTNKIRVNLLHEILDRAYRRGDLPTKFYAVTDSDSDAPADESPAVTRFEWNVYHIENFLLNADFIAKSVNSINNGGKLDPSFIFSQLELAARQASHNVLAHRMRKYVNSKIVNNIDLGFPPEAKSLGKELHEAVSRSVRRINDVAEGDLSEESLVQQAAQLQEDIDRTFVDGSWIKKLPGRDILKVFVRIMNLKISYEMLRNLIKSQMVEAGYKPSGMKDIIDKIRYD